MFKREGLYIKEGLFRNYGLLKVSGFTPEYQAVYNEFTEKPSPEIANSQNSLVSSIGKARWDNLDRFFCFRGHTNNNGESLIDWRNPSLYSATAVNSPSYQALRGFTGDNLSSYVKSNFNPSANGVKYTLNSATVGVYIESNIDDAGAIWGIDDGSKSAQLYFSSNAPNVFAKINDGSNLSGVLATGMAGMWILARTGVNERTLYHNKIPVLNDTTSSFDLGNYIIYILARNTSGTATLFSPQQVSLWFAGAAVNQTDVNLITDAFEAYRTATT